MPTHSTSAYKDGHKWIVFCVKCGQDIDLAASECDERYLTAVEHKGEWGVDTSNKLPYVSGIAKSAV